MPPKKRTKPVRQEGSARTIQHQRYVAGLYNHVLSPLRKALDKHKIPHAIPEQLPRERAAKKKG